jgi:hypothetical protein
VQLLKIQFTPDSDRKADIAESWQPIAMRFLGAAVIMQWNDLPTEIQRKLFDDAASMSDSARQFELKQQIARFLRSVEPTFSSVRTFQRCPRASSTAQRIVPSRGILVLGCQFGARSGFGAIIVR